MEAVAFFAFMAVLAWAAVAIERSRHAALIEVARLAAAAGSGIVSKDGIAPTPPTAQPGRPSETPSPVTMED